jgi:hypothetical protein
MEPWVIGVMIVLVVCWLMPGALFIAITLLDAWDDRR